MQYILGYEYRFESDLTRMTMALYILYCGPRALGRLYLAVRAFDFDIAGLLYCYSLLGVYCL